MCSTFDIDAPPADLVSCFRLAGPPPVPNRAQVRPTDLSLAIGPKRMGRLIRFGLSVSWSKKPVLNARAETISEKPTFKPLLNRRVIVPASAYTEWRHADGAKHRNSIHLKSKEIMGFAALLGDDAFVIVTCTPAPEIAHIHNRMPVVLADTAAENAWLDSTVPFNDVAGFLTPLSGDRLIAEEAA